ncbi:MAG: hypothetical protein D6775_15135 [Caldilineae bacterium]|nr:MAG: hypothetical protein D6775_15135 [Caldilineae bacterium]
MITVAAYGFIRRLRPDLVSGGAVRARGGKSWVGVALAATLLVVFLTPLASANPDGLERVARDLGFVDAARPSPLRLLANYRIPLLADSALATIAAALVGLVAVSGTVLLLLVLLRRFDRLQGRRADA